MTESPARCQQNFFQKEAFPATFPSFLQKLQGTPWTDGPGCAMMGLCQGRGPLWSVQPDTGHVCGKNFYDMEEPEMKKTKKLAALVLAMLMAFSLMAVTAAAYGAEHEHDGTCCEETIQPRRPAAQCLYCALGMDEYDTSMEDGIRYIIFKCYNDDCPYFVSNHVRATRKLKW